MSEHCHIRCATCDTDADLSWNHGAENLRALWSVRRAILAIDDAGVDLDVMRFGERIPVEFLREHRDHDVRIRSEYGRETAAEPDPIIAPLRARLVAELHAAGEPDAAEAAREPAVHVPTFAIGLSTSRVWPLLSEALRRDLLPVMPVITRPES